MYTAQQYAKAKEALNDPELESKVGAERMGKWAQSVAEYEAAQAGAPQGQADHGFQKPPSIEDFGNVQPDAARDGNLPSASYRKDLFAPPEYVSKTQSPLATIAKNTAIDPLVGPSSTMYFEPTEQQFAVDMGPYLAAKGVRPGSDEYGTAFGEYKDRKWKQAYDAAAAEDRPLTRSEYVKNSDAWHALGNALGKAGDSAAAFAYGFSRGGAPGLTQAISAAGGADVVDADRARASRNPGADTVGAFLGAINPRSVGNKVAGAVGRLAAPVGRFGASALAGAAGADADILASAGGDALADQLHGRPVDRDTKSQFAARLLGGSLLGAGAGVFGEGVATVAQKYRSGIRGAESKFGTELTNAESSGTTTDLVRGLEPSSDVRRLLEKARGPVPGEGKALSMGTPVELAAKEVRGPMVAQQVDEHAAALKRMEEETFRLYGSDPTLKAPKRMTELVKALRYHLVERSQPEAAGEFLPGADQALGGRNNAPIIDFARKAIKPRLVLGVDAAKEAARTGGEVVSLEDAARMGFKVKGLETELNPSTGLPHNAPSLGSYSNVSEGDLMPDGSMPWYPQANPVEVLPKYGKDTLAEHANELVGHPGATPEQAAALNKWSFGHDEAIRGVQRGTPDAEITQKRLEAYGGPVDKMGVPHEQHLAEAKEAAAHIAEYLKNTPASTKLPFVYRGLVLSREEAKKFLQNSSFDLGDAASSVSADPAVARSFVARNAKPGDVGITLKLEHNSARDISPYAADRVKVEKELMMPAGSKFAAVSRYEDASNPGHYIVVGKQAPPPGDPNATIPEITPGAEAAAAKPDVEVPDGYPSKSFQVVLEPRAYDAMKMEQQIKAIDQAGKAGTEAKVDPIWPELMRAARVDREQFGKAWSGLKNIHHEELTALEQRAGHAGIAGSDYYPGMNANQQKAVNNALTSYGVAPEETNLKLAELAGNAGVRPGLETLRGTRAYTALRESASPKANEGLANGGAFLRLGGFGPALKLRADALARDIARGPDGLPLFGDKATAAQANEPFGRSLLPSSGLLAMGRGAAGVKTGSLYDSTYNRPKPANSLSQQEREQLERLLAP